MDDSRIEELLDAVPALAVLAGLRLDLFSLVAGTPRTAAEVARRIGGDERRLEALLHALAALDLLEARPAAGGEPPRFLCRPAAARRLAASGDDYAGHGRALAARLWAAGLSVADSIRRGAATAPEAAGGDSPEETAAFLRALHPGALRTGREIARRGWLDGCRRIADAGGGSGGLAAALQQSLPGAEVTVVERESAAPWTRRLLEEEGAAGVRVVEGDLADGGSGLEGGLDLPCDGVVCLSVLQVLAPEDAARVIARFGGWLRSGGRLVIAGMGVLGDDRISPRDSAVHNILLGALYEAGRGYTLSEHGRWLEAAGFTAVEWDELADGRGAVRAVRR